MFGEDLSFLLVIAIAMTAGGLVKGLTGVALPMVSIAILSSAIDVRLALGIITIPIVLTNFWQAYHAGRPMETLRRFWLLLLCMLVFIWLGTNLVVLLPPQGLYAVIGTAIVVFTGTSYFMPSWTLPARAQTWTGPLAGALSGLLGGISTIWGPPLMMYFLMIRLPKDAFIRTTGLVWSAASIPLLAGYVRNGIVDAEIARLSAAACVPSFAGLWVGQWLRARIEPEAFRKVLLIVVFFIGLNLIRRALI
jgi:hypothetical protein